MEEIERGDDAVGEKLESELESEQQASALPCFRRHSQSLANTSIGKNCSDVKFRTEWIGSGHTHTNHTKQKQRQERRSDKNVSNDNNNCSSSIRTTPTASSSSSLAAAVWNTESFSRNSSSPFLVV